MPPAGKKGDKDKKTPVPSSTPNKTKKEKEAPKIKFTTIKCKICNKECLDPDSFNSEDDDSINCEECNHWFHKTCTNTTSAEWDALKGSNENITFRCDNCITYKGQHSNQMQMFQQLLRENNEILFKRLEGLESRIMLKVDEKIDKRFAEYEKKNDKSVDEKIKTQFDLKKQEQFTLENAIKTHVTETLDEIKDKEERKCNLMMFNVTESSKTNSNEESTDDLQSVKNILQHTNPELNDTVINQLSCNNMKRLGRKSASTDEESSKARPLKITLPDESTKFKILRNSHKLKTFKNNEKVGLKPDLTKQQMSEERELRKELQRRRDMNEDVMIYRNKVILRADHEKLKKEFLSKEQTAQTSQKHM